MSEQDLQEPTEASVAENEVDKDLVALYEQIQKAHEERDQIKDQMLRTMADFQNFRKRVMDEKQQITERANERFVSDLLPVLDNFERGLAVMEKGGTVESFVEGVKAVERQLRSVLDSQKVKRIPSVGEAFNPEVHEAIAMVESADHEDGTVIEELEAGYTLGDRVIRPARVRVSKRA